MRRFFSSLTAKFLLVLVPTILVGATAFSVLSAAFKADELEGLLRSKVEGVAETAAKALTLPLWNFDPAGITTVIDSITTHDEIECAVVAETISAQKWQVGMPDCTIPPGQWQNSVSVSIRHEGEAIGRLDLRYSTATIDQELMRQLLRDGGMLALLLGFVILTAFASLRIIIGRPLHHLMLSILQAEEHDLRKPVLWQSRDELGQVINAYNGMIHQIDQRTNDLAESEIRMRSILEASVFPIVIIRLSDMAILYYNQLAEAWFPPIAFSTMAPDPGGHRSVSGGPNGGIGALMEDAAVFASFRQALRQEGRVRGLEARLIGSEGRHFWAQISSVTMTFDGQEAALVAISDITELKELTQELTEKTSILEATLENMGQGIIMVEADGRIMAYNRRLIDMLRLAPRTLDNSSGFASLLTSDGGDSQRLADLLTRLALEATASQTTHQPRAGELRCQDGRVLEVRRNPLAGGSAVITLTDISERKQAQQRIEDQLAFQRTLLETIPNPIFYYDPEGRFLGCNQEFATQVTGQSVEALQGRGLAEVLQAEDAAPFEAWNRSLTGSPERRLVVERMMRFADGSRHHVILNSGVFQDSGGRAAGIVGLLVDITELKQTQDKMRRAKEEAEQAVADLRDAQESLVQAEKLASLGQLVAGIAHEINTPVGVAVTGASHLARRTAEIKQIFLESRVTKKELRSYLEAADETARLMLANMDRASSLIHSFKQVAVDQTSDERRRFVLRDYIDEVLLSLHPRLKKVPHHIALNCPSEITVDSYPGALARVLTNFIMNSLLHAWPDSAQAGTIDITAEEQAPDSLRLVYHDDGVGIPEEHQQKIFDPFFTTKRGSGGSGLGLNIVFNLVTQTLGGRIEMESAPGTGTTFTLTLPQQAPERLRRDAG